MHAGRRDNSRGKSTRDPISECMSLDLPFSDSITFHLIGVRLLSLEPVHPNDTAFTMENIGKIKSLYLYGLWPVSPGAASYLLFIALQKSFDKPHIFGEQASDNPHLCRSLSTNNSFLITGQTEGVNGIKE